MDELSYSQIGNYLLPNLGLEELSPTAETDSIGRYGLMRKHFLKQHRPMLYHSLLLRGGLFPHLKEIEVAANLQMTQAMKMLTAQNPPPPKEQDQLAWATHMNSLRAQAEETILNELIYS